MANPLKEESLETQKNVYSSHSLLEILPCFATVRVLRCGYRRGLPGNSKTSQH